MSVHSSQGEFPYQGDKDPPIGAVNKYASSGAGSFVSAAIIKPPQATSGSAQKRRLQLSARCVRPVGTLQSFGTCHTHLCGAHHVSHSIAAV
jgi:hypothetical protein